MSWLKPETKWNAAATTSESDVVSGPTKNGKCQTRVLHALFRRVVTREISQLPIPGWLKARISWGQLLSEQKSSLKSVTLETFHCAILMPLCVHGGSSPAQPVLVQQFSIAALSVSTDPNSVYEAAFVRCNSDSLSFVVHGFGQWARTCAAGVADHADDEEKTHLADGSVSRRREIRA